jgi:hypothetical protein
MSGEEILREELMQLFEAEKLQKRENPNDRRKVTESIFEGTFVSELK